MTIAIVILVVVLALAAAGQPGGYRPSGEPDTPYEPPSRDAT